MTTSAAKKSAMRLQSLNERTESDLFQRRRLNFGDNIVDIEGVINGFTGVAPLAKWTMDER